MADESLPGPVDFTLIEFPTSASVEAVAGALADLLDRGIVRLYDITVIERVGSAAATRADLASALGGAFSDFAGAQSGLFDDDDLVDAGGAMEADTIGLLIAYENAWTIPFVTAAYGAGGQLVASQRIPAQALIDALDATD